MYGTSGTHPYVLPGGILHDETDRGPLWDPVKNLYSFTYDYQTDKLLASNLTPNAPVGWFYFAGHWGDKFQKSRSPGNLSRQWRMRAENMAWREARFDSQKIPSCWRRRGDERRRRATSIWSRLRLCILKTWATDLMACDLLSNDAAFSWDCS
jgi:hypothetical protein